MSVSTPLCRLYAPSDILLQLANIFYNTIVKRNSVFVPTIFAGAFAFSIGFDVGVTKFWDTWNKGKQWQDIRHKYVEEE
ncbi:ubiquinol-cytochrome C reductase [Earliella scabrosa]|nr:ubiquinol-cytochrome C reductase [Earliella scabrosa]